MSRLENPLEIGGLTLSNRLYRAPLLECAGNGDDAVETLVSDLEPAAAAGAGLVCQGATIVRGEGGCAAPGMTRVHDPEFVAELSTLTDAIHAHGSRIAIQLEHGGLRSMETWHAGYRQANPNLQQLAVSRPPWPLRLLDRLGFLSYDAHVMTTEEVYELAADFGRSAAYAVDAGYDAIHLAGANMGIVQQFLSPFYNCRVDEFRDGVRFLELVHDEIRKRAGDVPLMTKVPAETEAPPFVRSRLSAVDAVRICERLAGIGYDALVPVNASVFWDMSIVRGEFPTRAWRDERYREGYAEAFGGRGRAALVAFGNWVESLAYDFDPAWNAGLCRAVRKRVDVPILAEGGIRERGEMERLLGRDCDMVGMARPFYAEPELPARLLGDTAGDTRVVCENCNNCAVPQATGEPGVCRTPEVLKRAGELRKQGAYERHGHSEAE
ncbi:NADH-dependent flavin oxidoreductase [Haloprofundus marisrubri]|uniref:NADH-dependent flavin oxidoreductase n=1 Tax=Haloprofundus marisrubri TaxID=1514971 RepID=A0A0W1RBR7_9EURY|nr:NADH-dependent flavin oxidoreductase [Haloprofundus marisrubri]KTG10067.1 NADH-dependent flavin oxidoreductase [Haloprofundus marisrubri]